MKKALNSAWVFFVILIGLYSALVVASGFFKWTDDKGIVHYGDQVPPEYSQRRQEEVNKYGMTVKVTDAPKTKEQLIEDERKSRIETEERHKLEKQRAWDWRLLDSYSNENDLTNVYKGKIEAIEGVIGIAQTNIGLLRKSIADLKNQAAEKERFNQPVSDKIRHDIASAGELIAKYDSYIKMKRKEQADINAQRDADLKRFRELRSMSETGSPESPQVQKEVVIATPSSDKDNKSRLDDTTFVTAECHDPKNCAKAWSMAKLYVQAKANTRLRIETNTRLVTREPNRSNAIGLSVTRTLDQKGGHLVMEVLCHDSPEGKKYCLTPQVQAIRDGFKGYVEGR